MPQPMPVEPAIPEPTPMPMNNDVPPQAPYNPTPNSGNNGGSNTGFIIGGVFLLLIIGIVALLILNPFENKTYDGGNSTSNTTNTTKKTDTNTTDNGTTNNTPTKTNKKYSCSNTLNEEGVKIGITMDFTEDGSDTDMKIKYVYTKTNGQAFTAQEKNAMTNNIDQSLRTSYASYGTVSSVTSSLSNGSVIINASVHLKNYSIETLKLESISQGFTCK